MAIEQNAKILVIGAGPIVIGQGCEFDYSGTQACRQLKKIGYQVILINPNPATVMTDPETAEIIYIEAINLANLEQIIIKHRPQFLLPTVGGQAGLNAALDLHENGILKKYNIEMLAVTPEAIKNAEDRKLFAQKMSEIGLKCPKSFIIDNLSDALEAIKKTGLPAIIRPSFTLGGEGGGIAYNEEEFIEIIKNGLQVSPTHQVQIDQSVIGWKELEFEVIKDLNGNKLMICGIENLEPMGVHTGDSITCAPFLTISNKELQIMRDAAFKIVEAVGVLAGGANVQFAVNPENGEVLVIEMNPRVSRSSALASKATGWPIAKISAMLAVGHTFDTIKNDYLDGISAALEPALDYVVVKVPKFNFQKFSGENDFLSSSMKSIGEAMGVGRNFEEALQKALSSLENDDLGLKSISSDRDFIIENLQIPSSKRILLIADALRIGISVSEICQLSTWDKWFVERIENIVYHEKFILQNDWQNWQKRHWLALKQAGLTDSRIAQLINQKNETDYYLNIIKENNLEKNTDNLTELKKILSEKNLLPENKKIEQISSQKVRQKRQEINIQAVYKKIDSCAAEFETNTQYHYSSFENCLNRPAKCESVVSAQKKVIIIGSGPNRIGQGIEFDYACVHACQTARKMGLQAIMINSNPSTVSTDFDTADKLYFEPLVFENVRNILQKENENLVGVITQFGGQTPLRLMKNGTFEGFEILGTPQKSINIAEDRQLFGELLQKLELKQVKNVICHTIAEIFEKIQQINFPILIRPSYVIGGRAMEILYNLEELEDYLVKHKKILQKSESILVDEFLLDAHEFDVEVIGDGQDYVVLAVMEHIEKAGVHSGDSTSVLPVFSINKSIENGLKEQALKLAQALQIKGLLNVQFAIKNEEIFVLEANPRASRTVPFIAKALKTNFIDIATQIMLGRTLKEIGLLKTPKNNLFAIKKSIFPFARFGKNNPILGPEMKSTGEVMGIDACFEAALAKAFNGWQKTLPLSGGVLFSVNDQDKAEASKIAKEFAELGFEIYATSGTAKFFQQNNLPAKLVKKMSEGRPNIVDLIINGKINLVINTPSNKSSYLKDGFQIRMSAISHNIYHTTTITSAAAILKAIKYLKKNQLTPHQM